MTNESSSQGSSYLAFLKHAFETLHRGRGSAAASNRRVISPDSIRDVPAARPIAPGASLSGEQSVRIEGAITGSGTVNLANDIEGSVHLPDSEVTIRAFGRVNGSIVARRVKILGRVTGDVAAKDYVAVTGTGRVQGDIVSPRLVVEDGARIEGKVQTRRDEAQFGENGSKPQ